MTPIRDLLRMIQFDQVDAYLVANGWERLNGGHARIQKYRVNIPGTDDDCHVILPSDRGHEQFADRLFRLVYQVSCVEDRQPFEVAEHIANQQAETSEPVCIKSAILEAATSSLDTTQTERLLDHIEPVIARAEFMAAGLGADKTKATLMKTAMVLVPAAKFVIPLCQPAVASKFVVAVVRRTLILEGSELDSNLLETLATDNESAPTASLQLLERLVD